MANETKLAYEFALCTDPSKLGTIAIKEGRITFCPGNKSVYIDRNNARTCLTNGIQTFTAANISVTEAVTCSSVTGVTFKVDSFYLNTTTNILYVVDSTGTNMYPLYGGTISALQTSINSKANAADVYTKAQTDSAISTAIANALSGDDTPVYSKDEVDDLLDGKADVATTLEGYGITDAVAKDDFVFWEAQPSPLICRANEDLTISASLNVEGATYKWETASDSELAKEHPTWTVTRTGNVIPVTNSGATVLNNNVRCVAEYNGKTYYSNIVRLMGPTLAANGITNAYTKSEVDAKIPDVSGFAKSADVYTKTEVNTELAKKADASTTYTKSQVDALIPDISGKANSSDVYTKSQVDAKIPDISGKANSADVYTKTQIDTALSGKADASTTYTKGQVDALIPDISGKANAADVYTKGQTDSAISTAIANALSGDDTPVYSKDEVDGLLGGKADAATTYSKSEVDALIPDISGKANASDVYTKAQVNTELGKKADASTTYTKSQVDALIPDISGKANSADVYTKTQVDALIPDISGKANASDVYTKAQVNTELGKKADASTTYTKSQVDALIPDISGKANSADVYTKTQVDTELGKKADAATTYTKDEVDELIPDISTKVDADKVYIKSEIDGALAGKANAGELTAKADKATTYTKTEVDSAINKIKLSGAYNSASKALTLSISKS